MLALSLIRPINEVEVERLENKFVMGYLEGDQALYLSIYKDDDKVLYVFDNIVASWSTYWKKANNDFEAKLVDDPDLAPLLGNEVGWQPPLDCMVLAHQ